MRQGLNRVFFQGTAACLFLLFALTGCALRGAVGDGSGKLIVVTSIFPVADIIRNVGGKRVQVTMLVQPGQSPHTYEPLPKEMELVSRADVFAIVGFGLEFWADKMIANVQNPKMVKLIFADYVKPIKDQNEKYNGGKFTGKEPSDKDRHGIYNPHIWLSPKNAIIMAEATRDALSKAKPSAAAEFAANWKSYTAELRKLDEWMTRETAKLPNKKFLSFHSAWTYLARDYGLDQVASIEESPGKETTPERLARIIDEVRRDKVKAVFAEPQFNPKTADVIASEAGVKVLFLDPIGNPNLTDRDSYIKLMHYNVRQLEKALK